MSAPPRPPSPQDRPTGRHSPEARSSGTHPPGAHRTPLSRFAYRAALAWSAAALGLALGWLTGVVPPGLSPADGFGVLLDIENLGVAAAVTCTVGAVGVVLALLLPRGLLPRLVEPMAWVLAGAVLLVFVDANLLVWLGYQPVILALVWFEPEVALGFVEFTFSPQMFHTLFFTLGAGLWAWAALAHRRNRRRQCARCGRGREWTPAVEREVRGRALRTGRIAVAGAFALALLYPVIRLPWIFGISMGLEEEAFAEVMSDPVMLMKGMGLASVAVLGAVLMLGLVQGWGVRFPRWMVGLAGRRVPVSLAVIPATLVAMALVAIGRGVLVLVVQTGGIPPGDETQAPAFIGMPFWGLALVVATVAYVVRRRAECGVCERGLPEAWPVAAPPVLSRRR